MRKQTIEELVFFDKFNRRKDKNTINEQIEKNRNKIENQNNKELRTKKLRKKQQRRCAYYIRFNTFKKYNKAENEEVNYFYKKSIFNFCY